MQAIEFETTVENKIVAIPQQYNLDNQKVRVIILTDAPMVKSSNKLMDVIISAKGKGCFKSASEIEQFIRHERNQWD